MNCDLIVGQSQTDGLSDVHVSSLQPLSNGAEI